MVSAVIILRLVDQGYLSLTSHPQDYISTWPITNTDPLYNMPLAQLLSFTSGLETEPVCLDNPSGFFQSCVNTIATANANNGVTPGQQFFYASTHLQVAGLMAIKAKGNSLGQTLTWQDLFTAFKSETGLFPTSTYDLPSAGNPRLAGGMHWTGEEYMAFLKAFKNGSLLSPALMAQMTANQVGSAAIVNSPVLTAPPNGLGEDWRYGFGLWLECQSPAYNCAPGGRLSSPGSYGAYPFWSQPYGYFGIVARQGALGTYPIGISVERTVQNTADQWAACQ
jgi:CubicO group peptidase (beta-lactamase class C family)